MSLFVYVIGPADEAGLLKIGRTGNVERRLAQMKGTSLAQEVAPGPLEMPSKHPLAFKRGTPPQDPSQDASKIFSPRRGTR